MVVLAEVVSGGKPNEQNRLRGITVAFISTFTVTEHEKKETTKQARGSEGMCAVINSGLGHQISFAIEFKPRQYYVAVTNLMLFPPRPGEAGTNCCYRETK